MTLREVCIRLADMKKKRRPLSRQTIYTMFARRELVAGITVAGMATVTVASWDAYVARFDAGEVR